MALKVELRKGETVEKALRKLKKKLDRENVIIDARNNRYFTPPSEEKKLRKKKLKFNDYLRNKYRDM